MTRGLSDVMYRVTYNTCDSTRDKILVNDGVDDLSFNSYIVVNTEDISHIECPLFCLNHVVKIVSSSPRDSETCPTKIIVPIEIAYPQNSIKAASIDSTFRDLFMTRMNSLALKKAIFKEETIYGGSQLIFNKELTPIYMATAKIDASRRAIFDMTIYIDPWVFTNKTNKIAKGIMSRLVPFYMGGHFLTNYGLLNYDGNLVYPAISFKHIPFVVNNYKKELSNCISPKTVLTQQMNTLLNSLQYAV